MARGCVRSGGGRGEPTGIPYRRPFYGRSGVWLKRGGTDHGTDKVLRGHCGRPAVGQDHGNDKVVPVSLQRRCGSAWRLVMVFLCNVLCFLERIDDAIRRDERRDWLVVFIEQHNVYAAVVAEIEIGAMRFGTG